MNSIPTAHLRRIALLAVALLVSLSVSGCFIENRTNLTSVSQDELSAGGEPYFDAGPITYQIEITRQLNPFATEDVQYLAGVKGAQDLDPDQLWFGVFLWAKNQTKNIVTTVPPSDVKIVDSEGTAYYPTPLDPTINPYAWTAQPLSPNAIEPGPSSTAGYGPTQGGLILFKLNDTVYANRPLTLYIQAPGEAKPSTVSLDL